MGGETFSAAWCLSSQWGFNYGNQWKTFLLLFHRKAIMLLIWTTQTSPACRFAIPVCGDLVAFWFSKNRHVSYHTSTVCASKAFISHSLETGYVLSSEGKRWSSNCDELREQKKQHLITDIEAVWIISGTVYNHFSFSMWELTIGCNYHQTPCYTYMPISSKLQHCNNGSTHVSVFQAIHLKMSQHFTNPSQRILAGWQQKKSSAINISIVQEMMKNKTLSSKFNSLPRPLL